MSEWVDVAAIEDLPPGSFRVVTVNEIAIAVFNLGGNYYAIENTCTHEKAELSGGRLDGEQIICPLHGARFSIVSGAVMGPPAYENLRTFPLRVSNGRIELDGKAEWSAS